MEYLAHIDIDSGRKQRIKDHLEGTAERARKFAEQFGKSDWGYCCGMLHDIGKYSKSFQKRINGESSQQVDHSTAGAQLCMERKGMYELLSYCIAGHHAGLPDCGGMSDRNGASTLMVTQHKEGDSWNISKQKKGRIDQSVLDEPKDTLMEKLHLMNGPYLTNAAMLLFSKAGRRLR